MYVVVDSYFEHESHFSTREKAEEYFDQRVQEFREAKLTGVRVRLYKVQKREVI